MCFNHLPLSRSRGIYWFLSDEKEHLVTFDKKRILNDSCKGEGFGMQKKSLGKTKENNPMFLKVSKS